MATAPLAHPGYRFRDLVGAVVVLTIGASMMYALYTAGEGRSIHIASMAFTISGVLLVFAYGSGFVIDRIARRLPSLVKPRRSAALGLLVCSAALTGAAIIAVTYKAWILSAAFELMAMARRHGVI